MAFAKRYRLFTRLLALFERNRTIMNDLVSSGTMAYFIIYIVQSEPLYPEDFN